jgi:hypothetical protein
MQSGAEEEGMAPGKISKILMAQCDFSGKIPRSQIGRRDLRANHWLNEGAA